jgi:hypothetical protein
VKNAVFALHESRPDPVRGARDTVTALHAGLYRFDACKGKAGNNGDNTLKLSRVVLQGTLTPMKSLIPRGTSCWQEVSNWPAFDPEKARALLAESKYGANPPSVRILVSGHSTRHQTIVFETAFRSILPNGVFGVCLFFV